MKIFGLTSVSPGYHMVKKIDGKIEVFHPSTLSIYYAKKNPDFSLHTDFSENN